MNTQQDGAIVVGVHESVFTGQALRWAAEQARLEDRRLVLVTASGSVSGAWSEHGMESVLDGDEAVRRRGEDLLDRAEAVVRQAEPGLEVRRHAAVADPRSLLVEMSATAHLLVLGSRGRGPVRSHLLGSVGLAVVRHAACPVVVHRPGHPGRVNRGVVVAADATSGSLPVLRFAFREASLRRLPLEVVHYVYDVRSTLVGVRMVGDLTEEKAEHGVALSESLAGLREDFPDVHVTVATSYGVPEPSLAAVSARADLLVLGSHQRGLLSRVLGGSVAGAVLEHAHCPVAVVPVAEPRG